MARNRLIIALAGLSGSGKTTLLQRLKDEVAFEHLSASKLLKERSAKSGKLVDSETLRLGNIDDNQHELILAFTEKLSQTECNIVFDCHTLIDTPNGLQFIPASVFRAMGFTHMAFLYLDPLILVERRNRDNSRFRPLRNSEELADQQVQAMNAALSIAQKNDMDFIDIAQNPYDSLLKLLRKSP